MINKIQFAKPKEINLITKGIRSVYNFNNINEYFKRDIPSIKNLIYNLKGIKVEGINKNNAIKSLITTLNYIVDELYKPVS